MSFPLGKAHLNILKEVRETYEAYEKSEKQEAYELSSSELLNYTGIYARLNEKEHLLPPHLILQTKRLGNIISTRLKHFCDLVEQ